MLRSTLTGCLALAISSSFSWGAVSAFEDFRTADGTPNLSDYWGTSPDTSPYLTIIPGNSPGLGYDSDTDTSYNGEGILDLHHTGTNSNAVALASTLNPLGAPLPRDATSKKVYFSVDLKPGSVAGGNLFNFFWERQNAAVIARVYCSGTAIQVRGNDAVPIPGSSVTLPADQWSRLVLEATYASAPADSSTLKVFLNGVLLGTGTYAAGPLANTSSTADPGLWVIQKDARTDIADDVHLYADLMTTSNVPIPMNVPEPTAVLLLLLGSVPFVMQRRMFNSK